MEASAAQQISYKVTRQEISPSFDPNSPEAATWTIYFTTIPSGVESFITVPGSQYTAANVAPLLLAQAQEIEAVHALGGEG